MAETLSDVTDSTVPNTSVEDDRPNGLLALPMVTNWLPAIALTAALFMPQVTGCDFKPIRPVDNLMLAAADQPLFAVVICWQHAYGLFVVILFAVLLATDRGTSDRKLAWATVGFWTLLVGAIFIQCIMTFDASETQSYVALLPLVLLPSYLCYAAMKRGDWIAAWARLATSIAALGILWTFMTYLFNRGARYGIYVTYGSLLILALAPWWLRVRWRQVLISSSEPSSPIRFRILHVLLVTTLIAVMYAYYRYVVPGL